MDTSEYQTPFLTNEGSNSTIWIVYIFTGNLFFTGHEICKKKMMQRGTDIQQQNFQFSFKGKFV